MLTAFSLPITLGITSQSVQARAEMEWRANFDYKLISRSFYVNRGGKVDISGYDVV